MMQTVHDYTEAAGPVVRVGLVADRPLTGDDSEALIEAAEFHTGMSAPFDVSVDGDRAILTYEAHP